MAKACRILGPRNCGVRCVYMYVYARAQCGIADIFLPNLKVLRWLTDARMGMPWVIEKQWGGIERIAHL